MRSRSRRRPPSSGCCARLRRSRRSTSTSASASGMLRSEGRGVAFRHDLARLAVEEEVAPVRREELHRRALAALADSSELAPARAPRRGGGRRGKRCCATRLRRPSAQRRWERIAKPPPVRARIALRRRAAVERARRVARARSRELYLTDDIDEAIVAGEEALALRRALGEPIEEGGRSAGSPRSSGARAGPPTPSASRATRSTCSRPSGGS